MSRHLQFSEYMAHHGNRRTFLKVFGTATGTAMLGGLTGCEQAAPPAPPATRPSHLVKFGHSDLYVSKLCQGTAFRRHLSREGGDAEAHKLIRYCIDIGINFFDSAEAYGSGGSEIALGKGVAGKRDQVIITTKAASTIGPDLQNVPGKRITFTKEIIFQKAEDSLKRLGTDYIDLYLLHGPDQATPMNDRPEGASNPDPGTPTLEHMQSIADAMDALVKSGKVRYWGVSNHLAQQVSELVDLGKRSGKSPIVGLEDYYNIAAGPRRRKFMSAELFPLIQKGNLGLMAFSPLGEGRLVPGRKVEEGPALVGLIKELDFVANELGVSRPQVCVAWSSNHPEVTSVLAGGEKPEHVADNFKGTELVLPKEAMQRLNAAADEYDAKRLKEIKST